MAKGIRRQAKSGTRKERARRGRAARDGGGGDGTTGGGAMQGMVSGLRRAVGVGGGADAGAKKGSLLGNLVWILLLAAVAAWAVSRYLG